MSEEYKTLEIEELSAWNSRYYVDYLFEILSGKKSLEEAREDILSFRNSEYYKGTKQEFKEIINE